MKKIALISALVLGTAVSGMVVAKGHGDKGSRMTERLNLTPEQQTQFDALRDEHRASMTKLHEGFTAQMRGLLTPEQLTTFDAMMEKRKERMGKHLGKKGYDRD